MRGVIAHRLYWQNSIRVPIGKSTYSSADLISPPVRKHVFKKLFFALAGTNTTYTFFSYLITMSSASSRVHNVNTGIVTSCVIGLALSYYAWVVEVAKERDDSYEAMCDLSEHFSCTKAFMSE